MHMPRFWKHKETKEVIDHLTYSDLKEPHSLDFQECDVTGELLNKEAVETSPVETPEVPPVNNEPAVANEDVVISEDTKDVN